MHAEKGSKHSTKIDRAYGNHLKDKKFLLKTWKKNPVSMCFYYSLQVWSCKFCNWLNRFVADRTYISCYKNLRIPKKEDEAFGLQQVEDW